MTPHPKVQRCAETRDASLYLTGEGLTSFPDEILALGDHLKSLNISKNAIKSLPAGISALKNLEELYLVGCSLSSLPAELFTLKKLKKVFLSGNQLASLPDSIGELSQLKELHLNENPLSSLPEGLGSLKKLKKLLLKELQLETLPRGLSKLGALTELDLWKAGLEGFPEVLLSMPRLESLNLSDNALGVLPTDLSGLESLEELDLSSTKLFEVPASLAALPKLRSLNISRNGVRRLPPELATAKALGSFNVYGNPIENLEAELVKNSRWDDIQKALQAQLPGGAAPASERTPAQRYAEFLKTADYEALTGSRVSGFDFRLAFDSPDVLAEGVAENNAHFEDALPGEYSVLALPSFTQEEAEAANPSSLDAFFVVDTSKPEHPVLLWTHDGGFGRFSKSFPAFLDGLKKG